MDRLTGQPGSNAMTSDGNYDDKEITAGLLVLIVLFYLLYVAVGAATRKIPAIGGYVLHADFVSASGLNVGDPVEVAGVKVGTVQSIRLADYQARVAFRVKDSVEVYEDASASIETEGLIGDRSISIDPGTAGRKPLEPGDEIKDRLAFEHHRIAGHIIDGRSDIRWINNRRCSRATALSLTRTAPAIEL